MTTAPIPTSLATACAAHDRHRLDVLDALLDEAAPSAVRELLGAALDLCASLRTRRDETEADLTSERAHLATCRTRIAGLEQAADERSAEVARLTAQLEAAQKAGWETVKAENQRAINAEAEVARLTNERSEWIHAAVSIGEHVDHLGPVAIGAGEINPREWIHYAQSLAGRVKARIGGLTARVAELEARPVLTEDALSKSLGWTRHVPKNVADETASDVLRHLGPVTLPSPDRAEELCREYHEDAADHDALMAGRWRNFGRGSHDICVKSMRRALAKLSPAPAREAAPTLVAVSDEELMHEFYTGAENGTRPVNGIRAELGAEVTEERVKAALKLVDGIEAKSWEAMSAEIARLTASRSDAAQSR
jgi:hypothetical protein